jgi:hypothetical protein
MAAMDSLDIPPAGTSKAIMDSKGTTASTAAMISTEGVMAGYSSACRSTSRRTTTHLPTRTPLRHRPTGTTARAMGRTTRRCRAVRRHGSRCPGSFQGGSPPGRVLQNCTESPYTRSRCPCPTRLPDELAGKEMAVACIAEQVTRDVTGGQQIHLGADVTRGGTRGTGGIRCRWCGQRPWSAGTGRGSGAIGRGTSTPVPAPLANVMFPLSLPVRSCPGCRTPGQRGSSTATLVSERRGPRRG